jgi:fatty-acyl-CoA synthase
MGDWFAKQTLGWLPERAAARWGAREALYFKGRRWSFAELAARIDRLARGLIGLGVEPGEKVALWMVNRPEFIEAMFAVMKIGAVLVPINTRLRTEDTAYILGQSDASVLLIADRSGPVDYLGMVRELAPSLRAGAVSEGRFKHLRLVVAAGEPHAETLAWTAAQAAGDRVDDAALRARAAAVEPDATAFFMYTSGTTGFPKGAMHSHAIVRNLVDRAFRMAITPADTIMMYLPLFHLFGFSDGALMSMVTGARQVLTETFDPDESLALVEQERATTSTASTRTSRN